MKKRKQIKKKIMIEDEILNNLILILLNKLM